MKMLSILLFIGFFCLEARVSPPDLKFLDIVKIQECKRLYPTYDGYHYLMVSDEKSLTFIDEKIRPLDYSVIERRILKVAPYEELLDSVNQPKFMVYADEEEELRISILPVSSIYVKWEASSDLTPTERESFKQESFEIPLHRSLLTRILFPVRRAWNAFFYPNEPIFLLIGRERVMSFTSQITLKTERLIKIQCN